jgi:ribosomal protein L11 methyltransferase
MAWIELSLDTTAEGVDWVCTLLAETEDVEDLGIANCPPQEESANWMFTLWFYLPYDRRSRSRVDAIAQLLSPLHRTGLTTELATVVVETKSVSACQNFPIHRIGQRFVVLATDAVYQSSPDELLLRLKPSLAFGSGLHPATILSLRLLERYVNPGMKALDLGCGSGILSVAIAQLGAQVLALDNDAIAVQATQATIHDNQVEAQVTVQCGSLGNGSRLGHWMSGTLTQAVTTIQAADLDLIAANILGRIHITLAADYRNALRSQGLLITAGFTSDQESEVVAALQAVGFETVESERSGDWVAIAHRLLPRSGSFDLTISEPKVEQSVDGFHRPARQS